MKIEAQPEYESTLTFAQFAFSEGNYRLAEQCYMQALKDAEIAHGIDSAEVGIVSLNFADFLSQTGRPDEIRPLLKRACLCLSHHQFMNYMIPKSSQVNLGH
jgi:Tfp pilus assembly protein PilF